MFRQKGKSYKLAKEEYKKIKNEMEVKLSVLQQKVVNEKIPVIILFEGFSASGKGGVISSLILNFDPRGFRVYSTRGANEKELRKPWLARFAEKAPEAGRISVFDRAWYSGMIQKLSGDEEEETLKNGFEDIKGFERQLADDGCVIIKFFLYIPEKEQKKRIGKLLADKNTAWRVTQKDIEKMQQYGKNLELYKKILENTDKPHARWNVVYAKDKKYTWATVMQTVAEELERAIANKQVVKEVQNQESKPYVSKKFDLLPTKKIQEYDLQKEMDKDTYKTKLKELQGELQELHNIIYRKKIPVIICYEGNDAAGKGGSIKRLARALDPRGYAVNPIGAPTKEELMHHYLWRFYNRLPLDGHIEIFDRTWYGRVLVERVEGFTPPNRIAQAYNEINEFESSLKRWGAVLIKFWLAIDKDEQLTRFKAREDSPEKRWKITDEDWRNREKWDVYTDAVNDMLQYTNTTYAPWTVVESNVKYYARIKTLETILAAIRERI